MASVVSEFFDLFPKIKYDITRARVKEYEEVTDVFFRIGIIREILNNNATYIEYEVEDGETPEIVAEKIYGDINSGWMVLYANQIFDPQFDWYLSDTQFANYVIGKYGSIERAQTTVHHYEKVITRLNITDDVTYETRLSLCPTRFTENIPTVPFDYYEGEYGYPKTGDSDFVKVDYNLTDDFTVDSDQFKKGQGLATKGSYTPPVEIAGKAYEEVSNARRVTNYEYEYELNEQRKFIKVIKADYYVRIMNNFKDLTGKDKRADYVRRLSV